MKRQKENKIIGQKIVKVELYDEYFVATLENGMEIEISDIITKRTSRNNKNYKNS